LDSQIEGVHHKEQSRAGQCHPEAKGRRPGVVFGRGRAQSPSRKTTMDSAVANINDKPDVEPRGEAQPGSGRQKIHMSYASHNAEHGNDMVATGSKNRR